MDTRGWSDIGYNFLISSKTGSIYEGRGWLVVGAHCAGYNTPYIGICVIGPDRAGIRDVSDAARRSVAWLVAEARRLKRGHSTGGLVVIGHRDRAATACPGDELYAWMRAGMPASGPATPSPDDDWTERIMETLPTLRLGSGNRRAVLVMQALINTQGGGLVEDGVFGPRTDAAVRTWQVRHCVPHSVRADGTGDGIFGPHSWQYALTM